MKHRSRTFTKLNKPKPTFRKIFSRQSPLHSLITSSASRAKDTLVVVALSCFPSTANRSNACGGNEMQFFLLTHRCALFCLIIVRRSRPSPSPVLRWILSPVLPPPGDASVIPLLDARRDGALIRIPCLARMCRTASVRQAPVSLSLLLFSVSSTSLRAYTSTYSVVRCIYIYIYTGALGALNYLPRKAVIFFCAGARAGLCNSILLFSSAFSFACRRGIYLRALAY